MARTPDILELELPVSCSLRRSRHGRRVDVAFGCCRLPWGCRGLELLEMQ